MSPTSNTLGKRDKDLYFQPFKFLNEFKIQESVEMAIRVSDLHMSLIRNCIPLVENNSGARVRCPTESNLVLLRGSLETTYFASEMLAVCRLNRFRI